MLTEQSFYVRCPFGLYVLVTIYRGPMTHLKHPDLADHGLGVDLTHVVAGVIPLHVPDVQLPSVDPVV